MDSSREPNVDPSSWILPIQVSLGTVRHGQVEACSISKVPDKLRKPNKDAYVPQVVSIGPYHRGSQNDLLLMMEQPKWNYMRSLIRRSVYQAQQEGRIEDGPGMVKVCGETILEIEYVVRASYVGNALSEPHELAKLMLLDGFFLLEFIHRLYEYKEALKAEDNGDYDDDPVFESHEKVLSVLSDLLLLENQVPFIVLKKLYRKLFPIPVPIQQDNRVATLAIGAVGYPSVVPTSGAAHLLHLVHLSIVNQEDRKKPRQALKELEHCATGLRARGVTIRRGGPGDRSNVNQFGDMFNFEIIFDNGVLEIPQLRIKKSTEVTWRNMIAWEQSRIVTSCKLTSYALFFQGLICCTHDIELLERLGIIVNESGKRNEDILKMFETLSQGVDQMDWSYSDVCAKLNSDTGKRSLTKWPAVTWHQCRRIIAIIFYYWKNWYDILIKEHIPTVWKLIGVLAAVALLGLTIAQTYYSAKSGN